MFFLKPHTLLLLWLIFQKRINIQFVVDDESFVHCGVCTVCTEPLKALDEVSTVLLCNKEKEKKQTQPSGHVQGSLTDQYNYLQQDIVSPESYTFSSTLCGLRYFPSTGSDCSSSLCRACFVSGTWAYRFRYYKPKVPYWFIAGGYTKQQGGLDLLEDYFAIL